MANKSEYLTALNALSYIQKVGTPVLQPSASDVELQLNVYIVPVLEKVNTTKAQRVKQVFCVYREGLTGETAFGPYEPVFKENDNIYQLIISYINSSIPNTKAYWIKEFSKELNYAKVRTYEHVTDHIEEKWYLIWNNNGLVHEEITTVLK